MKTNVVVIEYKWGSRPEVSLSYTPKPSFATFALVQGPAETLNSHNTRLPLLFRNDLPVFLDRDSIPASVYIGHFRANMLLQWILGYSCFFIETRIILLSVLTTMSSLSIYVIHLPILLYQTFLVPLLNRILINIIYTKFTDNKIIRNR